MSSFTEKLYLSPTDDLWVTTREITYEIGKKDSGIKIIIPSGTITDLATIPRILWPIINPNNPREASAFVLHDYLCNIEGFSKLVADSILRESLIVLGTSKTKSTLFFIAITLWRLM